MQIAGFQPGKLRQIIGVVINCPVQSCSVSLIGSVLSCASAGRAASSANAEAAALKPGFNVIFYPQMIVSIRQVTPRLSVESIAICGFLCF
jgi:hypothetical protein